MKFLEGFVILGFVKRLRLGYMGMALTENGVAFICLPKKTARLAKDAIRAHFSEKPVRFLKNVDLAVAAWRQLDGYFRGNVTEFDLPLDLGRGADFERTVWKSARTIPYGETRSYGWLADKAGRGFACRAAGNALGKNPLPILVPCHRVIRADGGLGGFGAGVAWKQRLLELEKGGVANV